MKVNLSDFIRPAGLLAGGLLILTGSPAFAADPLPSDAFPNFDSYIKISGQAASISGNEAAFQKRNALPSGGGIGIEDLHFSKDLSKTVTTVVDGRALTGSEDYLLSFNVAKTDVGSFEAGYKSFRTFYDGAGGFFPLNKNWQALTNEDLHIDRSKFWVEGTIALPNAPVLKLRYTNELRSGQKDSTIWGDSDNTGLAFNLAPNPISPARKFTPSYLEVNERHEHLELSASYKIKETDIEVAVFGDRTDNSDNRFVTRFPGETIPWAIASLSGAAQNAAKAAAPYTSWNNQVVIAENDAMKTASSGVTLAATTVLTSKLTLKLNGTYELVNTDIAGGRPLVTTTPTVAGPVLVSTDNYYGLNGGTKVNDYVANIALDYVPVPSVFIKLAFRAQEEYVNGASSYTVISASGTPAVTIASAPRTGFADINQTVTTPVLELRYTGIKDLALYFNGSLRNLNGDERNTSSYNPLTATSGTNATNNVSEDHGNYTFGANWRQSNVLTLRGELFHKSHKDNTVGYATTGPTVGDYYLLDSQYTGYKATALVKLNDELGFTTRFIYQKGTMQVTGFLPTFPAYDSLDAKNYMISESIDWTPTPQVYVQLNGTATFQVISTSYPRAGVTPAGTNNAFNTDGIVQNSNNNYMTGSLVAGFVATKQDDFQFQVNYYRANNSDSFLAPMTMPYGVAVRDVSVTVGVKHLFSNTLIGNAKVGYFESKNDTSGGFANYHGPIGYVSLDKAF